LKKDFENNDIRPYNFVSQESPGKPFKMSGTTFTRSPKKLTRFT